MTRHFLWFFISFLLLGIFTSSLDINLGQTEQADIIVPDHFPTIQEAVNNAVEEDTILVRNGTYYEHVLINKTVSLVGEDVNGTIVDGNGTGHVIAVVRDNVSISGFTLQNNGNVSWPALDAGICLNTTKDCVVSENRIVGNGFAGISLLNSQRNIVMDNYVVGMNWGAIHLLNSSYNVVSRNILHNNSYVGVNGHASSHYNNITENVISSSNYGMFYHDANYNNICGNNISHIAVEGVWLQERMSFNVVAKNRLTNCTVGIKLLGAFNMNNNNTISGNFLTGGRSGIHILNARYTEISNNTITNFYGDEWNAGIRLDSSGYSRIHSNTIEDNWRGILLYTSSPYASIYQNNLTENEFAIRVANGGSSYLNVTENIVMNNRGYGIGVTGFGGASNYAIISRNIIVNNSDGIALGRYSNYNTISHNNISDNGYGLYIEYSTQNTIWGNNIVDNDQQVYLTLDSINNWDDGYPSGGNYWSNHLGTDMYSGPLQSDTGKDGICDSPFLINGDNWDNYPLMYPLGFFPWDVTGDDCVNIDDILLAAEHFGSYPSHTRWNPVCDINTDSYIGVDDIVSVTEHFSECKR